MKTIVQRLAVLSYEHDSYFDKFINRGYTGAKNSDNGYETFYNTEHPDLKPTPVSSTGMCLYCGSKAHVIQAGLTPYRFNSFSAPSHAYDVTGHYCDCTHAAEYLRVQEQITEENNRHAAEISRLKSALPKQSDDIKAWCEMSSEQKAILRKLMSAE